jgi:hypothetical protein
MIVKPLAAAVLTASLFATAARADVRLGEDFSSDDAAGWQTAGDVSEQDNAGDRYIALTTASPVFEDDFPLPAGLFNLSGVAPIETGLALETLIGAAPGAFDLGDDFAYEGSAIRRTVNVNVGDILRFDWLLATNEIGAEARPDFAFLSVDGEVTRIASVADATSASTLDFLADTGIRSFEYVFSRGGSVQLVFGVVDVGDFGVTTALAIDNVSITAVPEPESWALMLAGLIGVAGAARRSLR